MYWLIEPCLLIGTKEYLLNELHGTKSKATVPSHVFVSYQMHFINKIDLCLLVTWDNHTSSTDDYSVVSTVVSNSRLHRSVSGQASGLLIPPKNIRSPPRNQPDSPYRPAQKNTTVQRRGVGEGASTLWISIWAFLTFFLLLLRLKGQTVRLYPAFLLTESLRLKSYTRF